MADKYVKERLMKYASFVRDTAYINLQSCPKTYTYDQDRAIPPDQTVKKVLGILKNSGLQIFESIKRVDVNLNLPVYLAKGGSDYNLLEFNYLFLTNKHNGTGKGATEIQAQASGLMEMVERFSACTYPYNEPNIYNDIKHLTPDIKLLFPLLCHVPDEEEIMEELKKVIMFWAPAYNMIKKEVQWIPSPYRHIVGFNGLASGNTIEEAVLQGIYEIIERHNISNIELNKINTPEIKIESINNPLAIDLINKYKKINMEIILKDFTLDMQIPTIGAVAYYKKGLDKYEWRYISTGTHTDPLKALFSALTGLPEHIKNPPVIMKEYTYSDQELENIKNSKYQIIRAGFLHKNSSAYLEKSENKINFSQIRNYAKKDIKEEIDMCVDILAKKGIEILVINMTHPDLNIPVVMVIGLNSLLYVPEAYINIHYYNGLCNEKIENYYGAIECFSKAKLYNPETGIIYYHIGLCHYSLYTILQNESDLELALQNFRIASELDPDYALSYGNIAAILLEKGEHKDALKFLEKAIELKPIYKDIPLYQKFLKLGLIKEN